MITRFSFIFFSKDILLVLDTYCSQWQRAIVKKYRKVAMFDSVGFSCGQGCNFWHPELYSTLCFYFTSSDVMPQCTTIKTCIKFQNKVKSSTRTHPVGPVGARLLIKFENVFSLQISFDISECFLFLSQFQDIMTYNLIGSTFFQNIRPH